MRHLILTFLLLLPFVTQAAEPKIVYLNYTPAVSDSISMDDDKVCTMYSKVASEALQNARLAESLDTLLEAWDDFIDSDKAVDFTDHNLKSYRELIILTWEISEKYPLLPLGTYRTFIYNTCAASKPLSKVKI